MSNFSFDLETNEPIAGSVPIADQANGWEIVENGRYRPRRTRGSCVGRELG
jgi:hypothetical protein